MRPLLRAFGPRTISAVALIVSACSADNSGPAMAGVGADVPGSVAAETDPLPADDLIPARVWRLGKEQYRSAVSALLPGVDLSVTDSFLPDEALGAYDNDAATLRVSTVRAGQYERAARSFGEYAATLADTLAPCPAMDLTACGLEFIQSFATRAFRRDLTPEEITALTAVWNEGVAARQLAGGVAALVETVLQAPSFLYRTELGDPALAGDTVSLTSVELASALAFSLTDQPPDEALLALGRSGSLSDPRVLETEARRLLTSPAGRATMTRFIEQWLDYDVLPTQQKDDTSLTGLAEAGDFATNWAPLMERELELYVDQVLQGDGSLFSLLTSPNTFANSSLGSVYGVSVSGDEWAPVALNPAERTGALMLSGFLASHAIGTSSHPIKRGLFVTERMLCRVVPPPPPGAAESPATKREGLTAKERLAAHRQDASCAACHTMLDPPGLAFENFDGFGRYRTTDSGKPIDPSGSLIVDDTLTVDFANANELVAGLAQSSTVAGCFAQQNFRFTLGVSQSDGTTALMQSLKERFLASGQNLTELAVAVVTSRGFTERRTTNESAP